MTYGDVEYWDNRYRMDPAPFDWYQHYDTLVPLFEKYLRKETRLLMVGCGNAVLSADMANDGYADIWNVDISPVVVSSMREKYASLTQLKYITMDTRQLDFEDNSFESVIDKGTLDSLMCGDSAPDNAGAMLSEVHRVMRPGGVYIMITYGDPRVRMPYLEKALDWSIALHVIPRPGSDRFIDKPVAKYLEPLHVSEDGRIGDDLHWDDADLHYVYVCRKKIGEKTGPL